MTEEEREELTRRKYFDLMIQFAYECDELPITTVRQILELLKQAKEEK